MNIHILFIEMKNISHTSCQRYSFSLHCIDYHYFYVFTCLQMNVFVSDAILDSYDSFCYREGKEEKEIRLGRDAYACKCIIIFS